MTDKEWQRIQEAGAKYKREVKRHQREVTLFTIGLLVSVAVLGGLIVWALILMSPR